MKHSKTKNGPVNYKFVKTTKLKEQPGSAPIKNKRNNDSDFRINTFYKPIVLLK